MHRSQFKIWLGNLDSAVSSSLLTLGLIVWGSFVFTLATPSRHVPPYSEANIRIGTDTGAQRPGHAPEIGGASESQ